MGSCLVKSSTHVGMIGTPRPFGPREDRDQRLVGDGVRLDISPLTVSRRSHDDVPDPLREDSWSETVSGEEGRRLE